MAIQFDGDVVVITGAARGLGRAHALLLADLGARVVVNDIGGSTDGQGADASAAAEVVREIEARGGTAVADANDGSTADGAHAMIATALAHFDRLDAVVANAGILRDKTFHKISDDDFLAVLQVHLIGTARVFHAAYPHMREQGYGRLVSTTSAAGLFGNFGQSNYAAAKMGIVGLTKALALEGAKANVRANVIAPGARTRMTEELLGAGADAFEPEKVSPLVACLCHSSLEASGQIFSVGGGRFARVAVGVTRGVRTEEPDADFVAAHMDEILGEEELVFPAHAFDEIELVTAPSEAS
jgi:NAD(P)-dependent dehydrogenase (short-subunit alcohol dehydrogenase family)